MTTSIRRQASLAARAIALIRERGAVRSTDLASALGVATPDVSAALNPYVVDGRLTACKVRQSTGRECNEYRIGAGIPDTFRPLTRASARAGAQIVPRTAQAPADRAPIGDARDEIIAAAEAQRLRVQAHRDAPRPAEAGPTNPATKCVGAAQTAQPEVAEGPALNNTGSAATDRASTSASPSGGCADAPPPLPAAGKGVGARCYVATQPPPLDRQRGPCVQFAMWDDGTLTIIDGNEVLQYDPQTAARLYEFLTGWAHLAPRVQP